MMLMVVMVWYIIWESQTFVLFITDRLTGWLLVDFTYFCLPTCSLSPFLQFSWLLGRSMDSLGHENLILLQLDFNLNVTWHFMFFLYLGIWDNKLKASCIIKSFLTAHYLSAPSGLVLYTTDSPAPILIVFFVTCLLAGQLKSIKVGIKKNEQ